MAYKCITKEKCSLAQIGEKHVRQMFVHFLEPPPFQPTGLRTKLRLKQVTQKGEDAGR